MSRLHGFKLDENRYEIIESHENFYTSYKLADKKSNEYCLFDMHYIIGLEQVGEDEFLVYKRGLGDNFRITRYQLKDSKINTLFDKEFSNFYFISDDRILFTYYGNNGRYYFSGIYSIKENKILEEAKWLDGTSIEVYGNELIVSYELSSYKLDNPRLMFTLKDSLEPNQYCYSTLRDKYIEVSSKEDIERIESEEKKYIRAIENIMYQEEKEHLKKVKEKLLLKKDVQ